MSAHAIESTIGRQARQPAGLAAAFALLASAVLLTSCPNPLPIDLAAQVTDETGPVITLESPIEGGVYDAALSVSGTVADAGGAVASVRLLIDELGIDEFLEIGEAGAFVHEIATVNLAETLTVELIAVDWNGNASVVTVGVVPNIEGPVFTIDSPDDEGVYGQTVRIVGSVVDNDSQISTVDLSVAAAGVEEALDVSEDGSFSYDLDCTGITRTVVITLSAADGHGNTSTAERILFNDGVGPHVSIASPADYSEYATLLTLTGTATNSENDQTTTEVVTPISYKIPGTDISGTLAIDRDNGSFSTQIDVSALDGSKTIEVTAADYNGYETTAVVTITKPADGGDISGFTVTPGNKQVTISWDPVPGAENYTLYEYRQGSDPRPATNPYVWEELENGIVYRFQLHADVPDACGSDAYSATLEVMPLSEMSLSPWIAEVGLASVSIEWVGIDAVNEYVVERRDSPHDQWRLVRYATDTSIIDDNARFGTEYSYRVYPTAFPDIKSVAAAGVATPFGYGFLGEYRTPGEATGVAVDDGYAYIADGTAGLRVIDISDRLSVSEVGNCATSGAAVDVVLSGDYAVLACGADGVDIVSISDPTHPTVVGWNGIEAADIAVNGSYAYVVYYGTLSVVDISVPTDPQFRSTQSVGGGADGVAANGSYLYVAAEGGGLKVYDLADPEDPAYLGMAWVAENGANDVAVSGSYAFVAHGGFGLQVFDVSSPTTPSVVGSCATAGSACDVVLSGSLAFVAVDDGGLQVIDISSPASPTTVRTIDRSDHAIGVAVDGRTAFLADSVNGLQLIGRWLPDTPELVGLSDYAPNAEDVVVDGNLAFVVDTTSYTGGLKIIDTSQPADPQPVGYYTSIGARDVVMFDHYVILSVGSYGLKIIDVTEPTNPTLVGSLPAASYVYDVDVAGPYAYIADGAVGVRIASIDDPTNPTVLGTCDTSGIARAVAVTGAHAFVADGARGLQILDVSDATNPSVLSGWEVSGGTDDVARDVAISGSYAYVADSVYGLQIIDISDPLNPTRVGQYAASGSRRLSVTGSYVYLAASSAGMRVIDVSDPSDPIDVGFYTTGANAHGAVVQDTYAYLAVYPVGLEIVDLSGEGG